MTGRAAQKAESIKLVALDVDGVMTDGTLFYRAVSEPETKPFNIKDGLGIKLLQRCDIDVAIITGRSSQALERRAGELGIATVIQGREDKGSALEELMKAKAKLPPRWPARARRLFLCIPAKPPMATWA